MDKDRLKAEALRFSAENMKEMEEHSILPKDEDVP